MAGFYGIRTVVADLKKHMRTGKVGAATLVPSDGSSSVAFSNAYVWPFDEGTALGGGGAPTVHTTITLWRIGEASRPRADDTVTDGGGFSWLVNSVNSRLNADEASNYAVYDLKCSRVATATG